jgi:FMN-dependent NADH-azoreductase
MPTMLHIDSSIWPATASTSRDIAATFRTEWKAVHPDGTIIYRDLTSEPLPHLDADAYTAGADNALRGQLISELEEADVVLIGAPMYNFTIPSTLKAWLDHVILMGRTTGVEDSRVAGTPAVVVASRGGGYGPGTPRESYEFVTTYLAKVLGPGGLGLDVTFIVPELTLAPIVPDMADLIGLSEASKAAAHADAAAKARLLAAKAA